MADGGLENGVGFGSADGGILKRGPCSSWRWKGEKGDHVGGGHVGGISLFLWSSPFPTIQVSGVPFVLSGQESSPVFKG